MNDDIIDRLRDAATAAGETIEDVPPLRARARSRTGARAAAQAARARVRGARTWLAPAAAAAAVAVAIGAGAAVQRVGGPEAASAPVPGEAAAPRFLAQVAGRDIVIRSAERGDEIARIAGPSQGEWFAQVQAARDNRVFYAATEAVDCSSRLFRFTLDESGTVASSGALPYGPPKGMVTTSLAVSGDGSKVAYGMHSCELAAATGRLVVHDTATGRLRTWSGKKPVTNLSMSDDGRYVAYREAALMTFHWTGQPAGARASARPSPSGPVAPERDRLDPTGDPTGDPTADPGAGPTGDPGAGPTAGPSAGPTADPGAGPTADPGAGPTADPGAGPTAGPGAGPTADPGAGPTAGPPGRAVPGEDGSGEGAGPHSVAVTVPPPAGGRVAEAEDAGPSDVVTPAPDSSLTEAEPVPVPRPTVTGDPLPERITPDPTAPPIQEPYSGTVRALDGPDPSRAAPMPKPAVTGKPEPLERGTQVLRVPDPRQVRILDTSADGDDLDRSHAITLSGPDGGLLGVVISPDGGRLHAGVGLSSSAAKEVVTGGIAEFDAARGTLLRQIVRVDEGRMYLLDGDGGGERFVVRRGEEYGVVDSGRYRTLMAAGDEPRSAVAW